MVPDTNLLESEDELVAPLRREILVSEEVRNAVLVLLGAIPLLLWNTPDDGLLHPRELSVKPLPAGLCLTLALDGLSNTNSLTLTLYFGLRHDVN